MELSRFGLGGALRDDLILCHVSSSWRFLLKSAPDSIVR